MYLSKEASLTTLRQVASLTAGSILAMTFILTLELIDPEERSQHQMVYERARAAGTPFISFFAPAEIMELARQAGFKNTQHVSKKDIVERYFAGRSDGLQPSSGEEMLIATV